MSAGVRSCDVIIVGAGHNGLTCAAYLGMAGLTVKVLERQSTVGGAAVTEEFHPGFRNSVAAYTVSLLNPKVIADLRLDAHGLRIVERRAQNFLPDPEGRYLLSGEGRTAREIARLNRGDAERFAAFDREIEIAADVLRGLVLKPPPNLARGLAGLGELIRAGALGRMLGRLSDESLRTLYTLFTRSAGEHLDGWFEDDLVKALFGFDAVVGFYGSPYTPGTGYVLLHHAFGEVNGKRRAWGHAIGGMGAISQAMARAASAYRVEIETGAAVRELVVEGGRAAGVALEDGRVLRADAVAVNANLKLFYTTMVDAAALDGDFLRRMQTFRCGSGTFRMNLALSELPSFAALPGRTLAEHHTAGIVIAPSLGYMDRAYADARQYGWSRQPIIELVIPSTLDETLAPKGAHVASLFCQHVAPTLPDGLSWNDRKDAVADLMIDTVERYAPGFRASVIARQVLSPLDLEQRFGLLGGDISHGVMSLDQLFWARPMLGYADYRGPLRGLYHCGAGAHPGGGVTGAAGHNAARAILADRRRPWQRVRSMI
ncbi:MAG: NAD(P)/FAD-dependent oxidoreductase [Hyphomicrobiales bacterium]|nr:NAD(P)/FAD-dependent oxidoreductase [Hyphomicrobiales bacterium]